VCQPGNYQPLLVRLAGRDQSEDVLGQRLARLDEVGVITLPELLEDRQRTFDRGGSNGCFEDIDVA
jgi:hypothetical protein